ncbi:hypothetical protein ACHAQA_006033 [Verticillium albo-atrum]
MSLPFPTIFLLPTHLTPERLHEIEESIPSLTYDIEEADVILGNLSKRERALFELRHRNLHTEPVGTPLATDPPSTPPRKRMKLSSNDDAESVSSISAKVVKVLKLAWLIDSLAQGEVLPTQPYLVYEGRVVASKPQFPQRPQSVQSSRPGGQGIQSTPTRRHALHKSSPTSQPPSLLRETTSEHDAAIHLPPVPAFLKTTYSCQRPTPVNSPNDAFVEALKEIRTIRKLLGDEIGVRAYSTSIATLAAYPYPLSTAPEVARLPGCGSKIAELYNQWTTTGSLAEIDSSRQDEKLAVVRLFYEIWGVGDTTAREFHRKGWRDLDDVVEHGWDGLSRVQQIGVKYYDEFLRPIPRPEVEAIGAVILEHARAIDPGFQLTVVGGYRRGKQRSGDVDVVLSHVDEAATYKFVERLVVSLEKSRHITHTLTLSTHNSERDQTPLTWKADAARTKGTGFDTLDKALVVWQEPAEGDDAAATAADRPHRRVDIIISPWKTVGCAVLGWSGGTTFQRDMRRYCKKEWGYKFDSSGIRRRSDGSWVDLEGGKLGVAPDMMTAEKRVFEGLGLEWRPPEQRCTG